MPRFLAVFFFAVVISSAQETPPEKKDEGKPKWDVNNPPGPSYDVTIDGVTDGGTWMSLDVSPAGEKSSSTSSAISTRSPSPAVKAKRSEHRHRLGHAAALLAERQVGSRSLPIAAAATTSGT